MQPTTEVAGVRCAGCGTDLQRDVACREWSCSACSATYDDDLKRTDRCEICQCDIKAERYAVVRTTENYHERVLVCRAHFDDDAAREAIRRAPPSADPLDAVIDGVMLRTLLDVDCDNRMDKPHPQAFRLSPAQRSAVSAHWSAELRAKVAASTAADREREARRVLVDLEDE